MKNFTYALRQVFRLRWGNLVKLISLTLGLVVGGSFFVRVAFERSYDRDLKDVERVYRLEANYILASGDNTQGEKIMAPVAPTLAAALPEIESATRFMEINDMSISADDEHFFTPTILIADSAIFDVLSYPILRGNPNRDLTVHGNVFLSQKYATRIFGTADPVGQKITIAGQYTFTVTGIFEDVPANSHLSFDVVTYMDGFFRDDWDGGDSFYAYLKFKPGADVTAAASKFKAIADPHQKQYSEISKVKIEYTLNPVRSIFADKFKNIDLIMAILALVVILVSSLNYVLMTISSLASRAKEIGVHKASGASTTGVFAIVMWETFIYVVAALGLAAFMVAASRSTLEPIMGSFDNLFTIKNLWALIVVVGTLFVTAGVIPSTIFARVPVTQIFRRYTDSKMLWKRALLFFQFFAAAFILAFLMVIVVQYNAIMNRTLGYDHQNVGYVTLATAELSQAQSLAREIEGMSGVGEVSLGNSLPLFGEGSGIGVNDIESEERLFRCGQFQVDSKFLQLFKIPLIKGRNLTDADSSAVVVNQHFEHKLPRGISALGYTFYGDGQLRTVVGVTADIKLASAYNNPDPIVFCPFSWTNSPFLIIRFSDYSRQNVAAIEKRLKELNPKLNYKVDSYSNALLWQHADTQMLRDGIVIASLVLLFITFLGVIGYTATEIRRRRSEMALRKINGATSADVTVLMVRSLLVLCFIASICGVISAYILGGYWQGDFVDKSPLYWWIFVASAIVVLVMVVATVVVQCRHIANANPARFIKSE